MKFRALINDPVHMKEFHGIISTLSKVAREAFCILQPDCVTLIVPANTVQSTPCIWADIGRTAYFTDYLMEGAHIETHNQIVLSFNAVKFAGALSTLGRSASSRYLKLKLTEKQFPCLTVDLEVPSSSSAQSRKVTHDVPVTLIQRRDWDDYRVPRLPTTIECGATTIGMPSLRSARNLMDKIKNLSPSVIVYCNNKDSLSLVCETDTVTVASHYRNLSVTLTTPAADGADDEVACRVSAKQFSMFLSSNQLVNGSMFCIIAQDQLIKMFTDVRRDVTLNCILYAVSL